MVAIMTIEEVLSAVKCSRSTLYVLMRREQFPAPFKVGPRRNRWVAAEVAEWLEKQVAARGA